MDHRQQLDEVLDLLITAHNDWLSTSMAINTEGNNASPSEEEEVTNAESTEDNMNNTQIDEAATSVQYNTGHGDFCFGRYLDRYRQDLDRYTAFLTADVEANTRDEVVIGGMMISKKVTNKRYVISSFVGMS